MICDGKIVQMSAKISANKWCFESSSSTNQIVRIIYN